MSIQPTARSRRAFTLVEILIVVVILGILAAIISPQFANTALESRETAVRSQLQVLRSQIELHDSRWIDDRFDPLNGGAQWTQLTTRRYINAPPENALQDGSTVVANAAAPGVGWVWVPHPNGSTGDIFPVDEDGNQLNW